MTDLGEALADRLWHLGGEARGLWLAEEGSTEGEALGRRIEDLADEVRPMGDRVGRLEDQVIELQERIRALTGPVEGPEGCTACSGHGTVMDPGYYVPGEQFVEPPHEGPCPACLGTGFREIAELAARVEQLDGWVSARDERIACLEDELAEAREGL